MRRKLKILCWVGAIVPAVAQVIGGWTYAAHNTEETSVYWRGGAIHILHFQQPGRFVERPSGDHAAWAGLILLPNWFSGVIHSSPAPPGVVGGQGFWFVVFPAYLFAVPFGAALLWSGLRTGSRRRRRRCLSCGYDLRGLPGGPCPECGKASGRDSA